MKDKTRWKPAVLNSPQQNTCHLFLVAWTSWPAITMKKPIPKTVHVCRMMNVAFAEEMASQKERVIAKAISQQLVTIAMAFASVIRTKMAFAMNSKWQVAQMLRHVTMMETLPMTMVHACSWTNVASAAVLVFSRALVVAMARSLKRATIAMVIALQMQTKTAFVMNLRFQAAQLPMPATITQKLPMTMALVRLRLPAPTAVASA